jgi:hypothetical protein
LKKRFLPDFKQLLLLEICLLRDPDAARNAWKTWKPSINFDELEPASFRVMSLVYRRMIELGIEDPDEGRIKGIYRYHWTRNQIAWRGKDKIVRKLGERGIDTLLLKGAALSRTVYPEPATRGMHDLDILVPLASAETAMALLTGEGWVAQQFKAIHATIERFHGCSFVHPEFRELDLHWHVMRSCCRTERDLELWAGARPLVIDGIQTKVLCPADMFLHACEHGTHPSPASTLQWMVDATFIIRNSPAPFDWARLMDQANKFRLVPMVRNTLEFIRSHFEPSIPQEVIHELSATPVALRDRAAYFLAGRPEEKQGRFHRALVGMGHYLNLTQGRSLGEKIRGFPLYHRMLIHEYRPWNIFLRDEARTLLNEWRDGYSETAFKVDRFFRQGVVPRGGLITRHRQDRLRNFYNVERELGSPFRWSDVDAAVELMLPCQPHVLCLGLRPFRDLTRLFDDGLIMYVNKHKVPSSAIHWREGFLICSIEAEWLNKNGWQKVSWSIRAWPAPSDPRSLGLPLSRLWTYPGKFEPSSA